MNTRYVTETFIVLLAMSYLGLTGCIKASVHNGELKAELASESGSSYYTNKNPIEVLITFNRPPDKFYPEQFALQNATMGAIEQVDKTTYRVQLIPSSQGAVQMNLPKGTAIGNRGEENTESDVFKVHYDSILPTIGAATILPAAVSPNPLPSVGGTTEPKAIVTLFNSLACTGDKLADATADAVTGSFEFPLGNALTAEGAYAWSVQARDAAGNIHCYPFPLAYTLDQTQPSLPSIATAHGAVQDNPVGVDVTSCDDDNQTPDSFYQVIFVQDSSAPPTLDNPDWISCAAGTNSVPLTGADGDHTLVMWARDEAGNISSSNQITVTLDSTTPSLSIPATASLNRNSGSTVILSDALVDSDEEGLGTYSLLAADAPACSDHGSVSINASNGAVTFAPAAHYFNRYSGADHHGGPCNIKVQFADRVQPAAHAVTSDVAVTVHFVNEPVQLTVWPGTSGTALEKCGNKCFANSIFDLNFTVSPGGNATYPDPQTVTCSAITADAYYVDIASCSLSGNTGTLSVQMGSAHGSSTDGTAISLTVNDGVGSDSDTFSLHVDNYVMSMYPALAVSRQLSCILCHANIQADIVTDFGIAQANYSNANNILGVANLAGSHMYHNDNSAIAFSVTGSIYMPDITVTDKNFIKQTTGNPNSAPVNLRSFLQNSWNQYSPITDSQGTILMDGDGFMQVDPTPIAKAPQLVAPNVQGGLQLRTAIKIRAPSDAEVLALDSSLSAGTTAFVYKGPNSKPAFSGLQIHDFGYGQFVRNNGTIVCHGSIIISGTLYLNNPDIQTDDVGCSIYVAGNVFIETNRGTAIQYVGGAASPTLQITSSRNLHMGVGLYDIRFVRRSLNNYEDAQKIVNPANPAGLRDAAEGALTIKSNNDAGAWEWMRCPLRPEHALYLEGKYISNGNYGACDASVDPWKCAFAKELFNNWVGVVSNYDHVLDERVINRSGTLVNPVVAYETMCRWNGAYQMSNYAGHSWAWSGYWGEQPERVGAASVNATRHSTIFDHVRINAQNVHSRYYGEFRGSVISPWALFAVGNLVFKYDTRLNNVVPYPRLMVPNPIFDVQ
ncbi:hemagglutinin [Bdellovibrio bacteriovorus]|uniref:Putative hemagglutinin/hemolysin-related protein n=1 Tax=Bdellovibrio bacteriovorus (strain ATCC 15356 / DSM 50701 / NCIMB 9529 / HD100) TaxID=264462 RepID=Q6MQ00_BDEBA|nr:hemagglutinin/hemolysin-related protein [Bdellovibrio bacteriovorus]CAE78647.1 putative hemagglutinin/hemolysin-related protein [Bdellovibrio bacteriovorus HD100]